MIPDHFDEIMPTSYGPPVALENPADGSVVIVDGAPGILTLGPVTAAKHPVRTMALEAFGSRLAESIREMPRCHFPEAP